MPAAPPPVHHVAVRGMHCAACVGRVGALLRSVPGVTGAEVNLATGQARVEGAVSFGALDTALAGSGFTLGLRTTRIPGASAQAAPSLSGLDGVRSVRSEPGALVVEHVDAPALLEPLRALLPAEAVLDVEADPDALWRAAEVRSWRWRFQLAAPLAALVLLGAMHGSAQHVPAALADARLHLLLTTLVLFGAGSRILAGAWRALVRRAPDMDLLVGLGTLTAWVASVPPVLAGTSGPLWLESAAVIVTLVCLGRWQEARARGRLGEAVARLARLAPVRALRVGPEGDHEVDAARLLPGDRVRVVPGAAVPADGVLLDGAAALDESLLTGESVPVERGVGAQVIGGSVNVAGSFVMQVQAVGPEAALGRIARWVADAQAGRAPIARLADRVAGVFVPVVLALAALTFLGHLALGGADGAAHGLSAAVAVLVLACPCALGLATPAAILAGTGRGAARGILIRGGEVLERAAAVRTVAFDKTGTLTLGRPQVAAVVPLAASRAELLAWSAAVERLSEHPYGRALCATAAAEGAPSAEAAEFRTVPGRGVAGTVDGRRVAVGNAAWMAEQGLDAERLKPALARADRDAGTALLVAVDGRLAGLFVLRDVERPEAAATLAALRAQGLAPWLVSGDRRAVVEALGARLGLTDLIAEAGPLEKARWVRERARTHGPVAMVGDGVNDAPALAEADVGIAVGGASAVSAGAAAIALTGGDLMRVPEALALARATLRTIRQNLAWAFGYNLLGLPLAALGVLPPMLGALAMALSSVSVVGNSLRLARWRWQAPA